jgi:hypothetical protein
MTPLALSMTMDIRECICQDLAAARIGVARRSETDNRSNTLSARLSVDPV